MIIWQIIIRDSNEKIYTNKETDRRAVRSGWYSFRLLLGQV